MNIIKKISDIICCVDLCINDRPNRSTLQQLYTSDLNKSDIIMINVIKLLVKKNNETYYDDLFIRPDNDNYTVADDSDNSLIPCIVNLTQTDDGGVMYNNPVITYDS